MVDVARLKLRSAACKAAVLSDELPPFVRKTQLKSLEVLGRGRRGAAGLEQIEHGFGGMGQGLAAVEQEKSSKGILRLRVPTGNHNGAISGRYMRRNATLRMTVGLCLGEDGSE